MGGFILFLIGIFLLLFLVFCIYFIIKALEFVVRAINFYKKMVSREDVMIKLLLDIRDNTKTVNSNNIDSLNDSQEDVIGYQYDSIDDEEEEYEDDILEELNSEDSESKKQNDEVNWLEENYYKIRKKAIRESISDLESDQELTMLNSISRLSYNELKSKGARPEDFTDVGLRVYRIYMGKIKQFEILSKENST